MDERQLLEELRVAREMGDRTPELNTLGNLGIGYDHQQHWQKGLDSWKRNDLHFREFLQLPNVTRIYINELTTSETASLPVKLLKLITEPEATAPDLATELADRARVEIPDLDLQENLINLLETIIVYKLPYKSREEIAAMLRMSNLKETRFYQEVFTEGRQEGRQEGEYVAKVATIRRLVGLGLSIEVIAQGVEMSIEQVRSILGE